MRLFIKQYCINALILICAFTHAIPTVQANPSAPPVRIAIIPGGGSGIEQEIVDGISNDLVNNHDVVLSTTNPDWYVVCNIHESLDQASGQIRYNGTVTAKTTDGHVLTNVAVQKYNQDFSLQPGAPLNKALVDSAAREVIAAISQRAIGPLNHAVQVEIETRDRIIKATNLAAQDKYTEAIGLLNPITPETTHFTQIRGLVREYQLEQSVLAKLATAQTLARQGKYSQAVNLLKEVPKASKRYKLALQRIGSYRAHLTGRPPHTTASGNQLQALEQQKKALEAQRKAIEAQEAVLKKNAR